MYNVGLGKKRYILPGKLQVEKNTVFACFRTYINCLYRSILSFSCIISFIISISMKLKFQKTKTEAPAAIINLFFKKYIYLSMSPGYFHQSDRFYQNICTSFMLSYGFFLDICFSLFLFVALLLFCCRFYSFLFCFYFWPKLQLQQ